MAEILLLKRKHFAEDVQPPTWSDLKWMGRPRQGDVVEVRPNGYFRIEALGTGLRGWDRNAFCLVQITNVSYETLAYLRQTYSNETDTTPATVFYKARYRIASWNLIPWIKNMVTINGVTVEEWYYIRSTIGGQFIVTDKVSG